MLYTADLGFVVEQPIVVVAPFDDWRALLYAFLIALLAEHDCHDDSIGDLEGATTPSRWPSTTRNPGPLGATRERGRARLSLLINCTQDSNAARGSAFLSVHCC